MIAQQYRVEVGIPDAVWEKFKDTPEYNFASSEATKGHIEAGCDFYSDVYEWAVFDALEKAQACEKKLMDMVYKFSARLL